MTTLFSKIIARELPAEILFENERVIAIRDIFPKAEVHILIITKKEIPDLQSMSAEDLPLLGEIVQAAQKLAKQLGIEKGYRLVTNNGALAGQSIFHLHFHLLGGKNLAPFH
jgi:histidine triad (HIT) family protein